MDSMETDAMDNNDATNEGAGDASNKDPVMEIGEASQVMHNEKGCGISAKAAFVAKDSYFSYLLLRHLKTRDMRMSVWERQYWCMNYIMNGNDSINL